MKGNIAHNAFLERAKVHILSSPGNTQSHALKIFRLSKTFSRWLAMQASSA